MNLWILKAKNSLPEGDDPWEPWYDKTFGFVIRANTEDDARRIADENMGDEGRGVFLGSVTAKTKNPWLDSRYSTCEILSDVGEEGVVIEDHRSA